MLARAFHDDPVFGFAMAQWEVACVDGRVAGGAVWFPPGTWSPGTEAAALPGYLRPSAVAP